MVTMNMFAEIKKVVEKAGGKEAEKTIGKLKKELEKQHTYYNLTGNRNKELDKLVYLILKKGG